METFDRGMPDPLHRILWTSDYQWTPGLDGSFTSVPGALWSASTVAGAGAVDGELQLKNGQGWWDWLYGPGTSYAWGRTSFVQCFERTSLDQQLQSLGPEGGEIDYTELFEIHVLGLQTERNPYAFPVRPSGGADAWLRFGIFKLLEMQVVYTQGTYAGTTSQDWFLQWGVDDRFNSSVTILRRQNPVSVDSTISLKVHFHNAWYAELDTFPTVDVRFEIRIDDVLFVEDDWFWEWTPAGQGNPSLYPYAWADAYTPPISYGAGVRVDGYDAATDLHDTDSVWRLDDWNFYNTPA